MIRRSGTSALIAVLALAACSDPSTPKTPDPKSVLAASASGLSAGNYRYTVDMPDVRVEGVTDFASRSAAWTTTFLDPGRMEIEIRLIGQDQYTRTRHDAASAANEKKSLRETAASTDDPHVKADMAAKIREIETGDDRYRHLDLSRLPKRTAMTGPPFADPDRTGATKLIPWVRDATADGSTIRGTLSIPRPLGGEALAMISERLVDTLPFTASLDEQRRLSRLEINFPTSARGTKPAGRWMLTVDSYGTAPVPERPGTIKETPEDVYDALES
ncbi:hypothetical protein AB0C29_01435 [Actinoplanes sp. NPDC048791]|uniref:hypothetical protein n=1 Tax=Actinoplanes sp. NPDC048791 TaxID=3154623 RepID=UPI0033E15193